MTRRRRHCSVVLKVSESQREQPLPLALVRTVSLVGEQWRVAGDLGEPIDGFRESLSWRWSPVAPRGVRVDRL
jgi:hypothetical protein